MEIKDICEAYGIDDIGDFSDGFHTFNQLYHQRAVLFATIVNNFKRHAWKSLKHEDGKYCFDSDGKWYYNEWWKSERPEPKYCGQWVTNNGFITMYEEDGGVKNYYRYEISNDGKTLNFYRKDSNGEYTKKGGDYTKQ